MFWTDDTKMPASNALTEITGIKHIDVFIGQAAQALIALIVDGLRFFCQGLDLRRFGENCDLNAAKNIAVFIVITRVQNFPQVA